jgi:hypothetical protein
MKINFDLLADLLIAQKRVYEPLGLICKNLQQETESQEYSACSFELNGSVIKFRVAKITPTKIGQFVTFWKRIGSGPIMPYDRADPFDFLVVSVRAVDNLGQFVFPKAVLYEEGLVSKDGKGGKRAMRVYPPWNITDSKQAKNTQSWQLKYFFQIEPAIDNFAVKQCVSTMLNSNLP